MLQRIQQQSPLTTTTTTTTTKRTQEKSGEKKKKKYNNSSNNKNNKPPRIVILSGPHKTASTTIQTFFADIAGITISLDNDEGKKRNNSQRRRRRYIKIPHYNFTRYTNWIFPIGMIEDYSSLLLVDEEKNSSSSSISIGIRRPHSNGKFYASLASYISERRMGYFFPHYNDVNINNKIEFRNMVANYYRKLLKRPWMAGKNLIIAAEAFDTIIMDIGNNNNNDKKNETSIFIGKEGEDLHITRRSSDMIDTLLDVLPWNITTTTAATATQHSQLQRGLDNTNANDTTNNRPPPSPLQLDDIEIQLNYRLPRITHLESLWHQRGGKNTTLREFILYRKVFEPYQMNTLALALQYVHKNIKTTIIDMKGVIVEKEERIEKKNNNTADVVVVDTHSNKIGGLEGVIACDILRVGMNLCDDESRISIPGYNDYDDGTTTTTTTAISQQQKVLNKKNATTVRDLSDEQLEEIDRVLIQYDCMIWFNYLQKYQSKGLLRILYPSKDSIFINCSNSSSSISINSNNSSYSSNNNKKDVVSFHDVILRIKHIARGGGGREEEGRLLI